MSTSAPTVRAVVADSNTVVQGDWWMVGAPWRITCFRAQQGDVRLVVPEMVMMEVTGRFRAHASSELEKLKSGQRLLTRLGMEIDWPDLDVDVGEMADRYRASLEARVLGARGIIAQLPDVDLMRLVKKAIDRTPPFDSNGNGFRDALLWEHVLQQPDTAATVALISNDHRAFAASKDQPGVLSSGLTAEVAGRGFDEDAVRLYPDVAAFLRAAGTVDLEAFAAVADIIEEDRDQLAANLTIAIGRADISDRNGRAQVFLERSHEPASIDLVDVTAPDDSMLSLVTLEGDADVDLYVEWTDFDRGHLGGSISKTVTYGATATYNHGTGLLDDFSVGEIRVGIDVSQPRLQREHKWTDGDLFRGRHLFGDGEEIVI